MSAVQITDRIVANPKVRGGRPYIRGTTVTVADVIIARLYHGLDADDIAAWYGLSLPEVYTALAYYYDHKDDMDRQIKEQIQRAERLKEEHLARQASLLPR
jgi:uncharacterized protein (DUF433 family)